VAVSKRTRFEVFKRDGFACQYCGRTPPAVTLEADHIHPASEGGPDDMDNLVTACFDCNRGKSDVLLSSLPAPLSQVMEEAAERRAQLEAYNQFLQEGRATEDERVERLGVVWYDAIALPHETGQYVFGAPRRASVRAFLRRLPLAEVEEAMELAQARVFVALGGHDEKRWRYFCGVCWNKIRAAEGGTG
jgi:hypothetical protein